MRSRPIPSPTPSPPLNRENRAGTTPALTIEFRRVQELKPRKGQPRIHSPAQIRQIADSIGTFGFNNPILVDGKDAVVAGHGRLDAAKLLGIERVPAVRLDHMTEAQVRAYVLADNRLAENAKWDRELLAIEFAYLRELELDFEIAVTGFDIAEIDLLFQHATSRSNASDPDTLPPDIPGLATVSRPRDLWALGRHRLLCADARDAASYRQLLGSHRAQLVVTDPPYNVRIDGHASGLGQARHKEFAMASGEMTEAQFTEFLQTIFGSLAAHSVDGSLHYIFMDWRHLYEALTAGREVYTELKNLCVWNKTNAGMGSLYRSKHELVLVFKNGRRPHINNVELGRHGRYRTNVWDHPGSNSFGPDRTDSLIMHPTVKPVDLVADVLLDCSRRGATILDPFAGSGTTIIAAEKTGRNAYAIEIDRGYVDTAIRRYEAFTGDAAIHIESGRKFRDLCKQRGRKPPATNSTTIVDGVARSAPGEGTRRRPQSALKNSAQRQRSESAACPKRRKPHLRDG